MLTKIELTNFQKHKTLKLKLGRVTTIVGPSDTGKSALLRALRWVLLNRPNGTGFIRKGAKAAAVRVEVDGTEIIRERGPGTNLYSTALSYKAFGNEVPREIAELVNVDGNNFQGQHDAPFWFSLTPGQVSKELNRIVNLDRIDRTLQRVKQETTKEKMRGRVLRGRLKEAKEAVADLKWVEGAAREWERIERIQSQNSILRSRIEELAPLIQDLATLEDAAQSIVDAAKGAKRELGRLEKARNALLSLTEREERLSGLLGSIKAEEADQWAKREGLKIGQKALKKLQRSACPLCGRGPSSSE